MRRTAPRAPAGASHANRRPLSSLAIARIGRQAAPAPAPRPARARRAPTLAVLTDRGRALDPGTVTIKKSLGEGSYGQVFEGTLTAADGGASRVVLKRFKPRVAGAAAFFEAEHVLNVYATAKAGAGVAPFLGYVDVGDADATPRLAAGVWLCWRYEGWKTLAYYLRRRDCEAALAADVGVGEGDVVATVVGDVLTALRSLHAAGLIHRDVKPQNVVLAEPAVVAAEDARLGRGGSAAPRVSRSGSASAASAAAPRMKLIDLGAAADLRRGTNYTPDESVLDPAYCPPEQFVLPTAGPALASARPLPGARALLSASLWRKHAPDAFDAYSVGVLLVQLGVPRLRKASTLATFSTALVSRHGNDLIAWRDAERVTSPVLDADGGAGWDLAAALLRARNVVRDGDGGVAFTGAGGRPSAAEALRHPFVASRWVPLAKRAVGAGEAAAPAPVAVRKAAGSTAQAPTNAAATPASKPSSSSAGVLAAAATSVWKRATRRLFDLESRLVSQAGLVEAATTRVQLASRAAAKGGADAAAALAREEAALAREAGKLDGLASEFKATASRAGDTLAGLWGKAADDGDDEGDGVDPVAAAAASGSGAAAGTASGAASSSTSSPVRDAAIGGVYGALKFTGAALRVASALAATVAARAASAADDAGVDPATAAATGVGRAAGLAYVDALRELAPAADSSYELDVAPKLQRDPRARAVPAAAARGLFNAYVDALQRAEQARKDAAAAAFEDLLAEAAPFPANTPWTEIEPMLATDARHAAAVAAGCDLRAVFEGATTVAAQEAAFRDALAGAIPQAGRKGDRWGSVRPYMVDDPRFAPVAELRRRELFADARAEIDAAEAAAAAASAAAAAKADAAARAAAVRAEAVRDLAAARTAAAAAVGDCVSDGGDAVAITLTTASADDDDLSLRGERNRLRAEYEEMERRLAAMEKALDESARE